MEGASVAGDVVAAGRAALAAGCDMVLVCNDPERADRLLDNLDDSRDAASQRRLAAMRSDGVDRRGDPRYVRAVARLNEAGLIAS